MLEKASIAAHEIEQTEKRYLEGLGATWKDFEGKKILDIGAQDVAFARAAQKHGVEVVPLDLRSEKRIWKSTGIDPQPKDKFVQADVNNLPFANESFDMVISHAGPLTGAGTQSELNAVFREVWRVLQPGGELRFGRTFTSLNIDEERIAKLPKNNILAQNILHARARSVLMDIVKEVPFEIAEFRVHKRGKEGFSYCHYVLRKPNTVASETLDG